MVYNVYGSNLQPSLLENHELICCAYAKCPNFASYAEVATNPSCFFPPEFMFCKCIERYNH